MVARIVEISAQFSVRSSLGMPMLDMAGFNPPVRSAPFPVAAGSSGPRIEIFEIKILNL
jgi:hypothetical protein